MVSQRRRNFAKSRFKNVTYGLDDPDVVSAVVLLGLALADALRAVARLEREAIVVAVGQRHVGEVH